MVGACNIYVYKCVRVSVLKQRLGYSSRVAVEIVRASVWTFFSVPHKFLNKYKSNWIRETLWWSGFIYFFFSAVSPIDNIAQRRSTCDGIVCAMRSQVGVYHNHIGTTALCVGIYRAHTVYAVIANGRANIFLFPRSTHHFIRIYLQTDARSSLLLFPDTSSPAAGHCYRIFRFLRYYIIFGDDDVYIRSFSSLPPARLHIILLLLLSSPEKYRNSNNIQWMVHTPRRSAVAVHQNKREHISRKRLVKYTHNML